MVTKLKWTAPTENGQVVYMMRDGEDGFILKNHSRMPTIAKNWTKVRKEAFKRDDWNDYKIKCHGNHIQIWVNGTKTTDLKDNTDKKGFLAIQHHGENGQIYRFKSLRLLEL